jgi:hypothetical protein
VPSRKSRPPKRVSPSLSTWSPMTRINGAEKKKAKKMEYTGHGHTSAAPHWLLASRLQPIAGIRTTQIPTTQIPRSSNSGTPWQQVLQNLREPGSWGRISE